MTRQSTHGIVYQSTEVVLLYKSRQLRPQDEADFAIVLLTLRHDAVRWLRDSVAPQIPDHSWVPALDAALSKTAGRCPNCRD